MDPTQERQLNQVAYRQMKDRLAQTYPQGRYVAIAEGASMVRVGTALFGARPRKA